MTALTRTLHRKVQGHDGSDYVVSLAAEGIYLRRPRRRTKYLLPYSHAFLRAAYLEADRQRREKQAKKAATKAARKAARKRKR